MKRIRMTSRHLTCALTALAWLTVSSICAVGAMSPVIVSGVTNTQAILTWDAPDTNPCRVEISESPDFSPLVNDVDPAKFPGSDQDNRAGSIVNGRSRTFVAGKRTTERATDLNRYSRALQMLTEHYFRITCGASQMTGQFQTQNLAFGNTFTDPPPTGDNPGEFGWPTLSATDRNQKIIDPQTGALIRRVSLASDRVITYSADPISVSRSTGWSNPMAATSNTDGNTSATVSGDSLSTLFLALDPQSRLSGAVNGPNNENSVINYYQATLSASSSNNSCSTTGGDDCKIVVCLSVDGVNCRAGGYQYEQALAPGFHNYVFGSTNSWDVWQMPGSPPPSAIDAAVRNGSVTCDGSATVTWVSGTGFSTAWSQGSAVLINSTSYTVASIKNSRILQLTAACTATPQPVPYQGLNFGILVRKKTASADTVSIQYGSVADQISVKPFFDYSGDFELCGSVPVIGPTGNPGYNCQTLVSGPVYWIDGVTGEAHVIAKSCGQFDTNVWDPIDPDVFYCGSSTITRTKYFGNHKEPSSSGNSTFNEEGYDLPSCTGPTNQPTNQPCYSSSSLTGSTNMANLLVAYAANDAAHGSGPGFDPNAFQSWAFTGLENGKIEIRVYRGPAGASGSIGWALVYDPNATSNGELNNAGCVGGGLPGCIVAAMPTWTHPGARWCPLKSISPVNTKDWALITPYYWGAAGETQAGRGPYEVIVQGNGFSNQANVSGGVTACPANQWGATQCTTIAVDGELRDSSPCTTSVAVCGSLETGLPGEIGTAQPGDYFTINDTSFYNSEAVRLIQKNGNTWIVQRSINALPLANNTGPATRLYATCNSVNNPERLGVADLEIFWNYAADPHGYNATGKTVTGDYYGINAHYYWQNGTQAVGYTIDPRCVSTTGANCYQTRYGTDLYSVLTTPPIAIEQLNPAFAGHLSYAGGDEIQSHPWGPGQNSPALDRQFFWDGRPFNGTAVTGSASAPATLVTGNLWKLTASQVPMLSRKFQPTLAFAGSSSLKDISSPASGNVIGGGPENRYQYCVAAKADECVDGSAAGDVYVNAPYVTQPFCYTPGQATPLGDDTDICVTNNAMVYNSIMQIGLKWIDNTGKYQRMYTRGLTHGRREQPFWHGHNLPNSRWMILLTSWADDLMDQIFAVKVTPPPPIDSIARNTFIPIRVTLKPPARLNVSNAFVEFGYSEYGAAGSYFCTSRAESCAASASQVNPTNPFYFETTEASSLTGVPCSGGCTIAIPGVSQRVVYGRVVYRDGTGKALARSIPFAIATP